MNKNWVFHQGEIYFADLGVGYGSEQGGKRPVVILQNNVGNRFAPTLTIVPITSHTKKTSQPTHFIFQPRSALKGVSMVLAEQIQTIDKQRILSYVGKLNEEEFSGVMDAVCVHLGMKNGHQE